MDHLRNHRTSLDNWSNGLVRTSNPLNDSGPLGAYPAGAQEDVYLITLFTSNDVACNITRVQKLFPDF